MARITDTILKSYQVRKTKKQKTAFIELLQKQFPELCVEKAGSMNSRNLIAGDIQTAQVIFTAHYDTCGRSLFPNISTPFNTGFKFIYTMLTVMPLVVIVLIANAVMIHFSARETLRLCVVMGLYFGLFFLQFFCGPPNQHTANDNTSGVCVLVQLLETLTPEERSKVALVFFDNEEQGCVGSAAFRKLHKAETENKLIFNLDCVADGDHFLFIATDPAEAQWTPLLQDAFPAPEGKTVSFANSKIARYSSDQKRFPVSIGAAALHEHSVLGLYFSRIHTDKDTVFQEENIAFLRDGIRNLIGKL